MRIVKFNDFKFDGSGFVCRQGRLSGGLASILMSAIFVASPIFWWFVGAPWIVWTLCALFAVLIVPMLIGDLRDRFRPSNWLVWLHPHGLAINLRSYRDRSSPDVLAVVQLDDREIAEVHRHAESFSTFASDGERTDHRVVSLDIRLHDADTSALEDEIRANRLRPQPRRVYFRGITVTSGLPPTGISIPAPGTIRIAWRGGHYWVSPSVSRVLDVLVGRVQIGPATFHRIPNERDVPAEVEVS